MTNGIENNKTCLKSEASSDIVRFRKLSNVLMMSVLCVVAVTVQELRQSRADSSQLGL